MNPTDALTTPSDANIIPPLADLIVSGMGTILSPAAWVRTVMSWVFDWDPLGEVMKHFAGDWNAVAQSSRAYEHLAEFSSLTGEEITVESRDAMADWEGNAADTANAYMTESLAPALQSLRRALNEVAGEYRAVSVGMHRTAELVISLFTSVIDWILIAAASAAAAAATSWTIVGGIVGGAGTAAAVTKAVKVAGEIATAFTWAQRLIDTVVGLIPGFLGAIKGFRDVAVPEGYDHAYA